MIPLRDLSPAELAALLHFHADAGVEWLLEEEAVDRIAEFSATKAARAAPAQPARQEEARMPAAASLAAVAIPDGQAVAEAERIAAGAGSLDALKVAMEAFNGCNLKTSARSLVFAEGNPRPDVMVIGAMPNADDDRDGRPFSGRQGVMLDRMLAGIGLDRAQLLVTTVVPWRPPGNRPPSRHEAEICRPFIERQIALAEPRRLLLLGNFAARFLLRASETIHQLRGEWREVEIAGRTIPAFATLNPQDLVAAPISKRLAWQDLLAFRAGVDS